MRLKSIFNAGDLGLTSSKYGFFDTVDIVEIYDGKLVSKIDFFVLKGRKRVCFV